MKAVILKNSRAALLRLQYTNIATIFCREVFGAFRSAGDSGWTFKLQWIPSHVGVRANEVAGSLARQAHAHDNSIIILNRFVECSPLYTA